MQYDNNYARKYCSCSCSCTRETYPKIIANGAIAALLNIITISLRSVRRVCSCEFIPHPPLIRPRYRVK